jgi:hypothetical protein
VDAPGREAGERSPGGERLLLDEHPQRRRGDCP